MARMKTTYTSPNRMKPYDNLNHMLTPAAIYNRWRRMRLLGNPGADVILLQHADVITKFKNQDHEGLAFIKKVENERERRKQFEILKQEVNNIAQTLTDFANHMYNKRREEEMRSISVPAIVLPNSHTLFVNSEIKKRHASL